MGCRSDPVPVFPGVTWQPPPVPVPSLAQQWSERSLSGPPPAPLCAPPSDAECPSEQEKEEVEVNVNLNLMEGSYSPIKLHTRLTFTCWEFSERLSSLFLASSMSRAFLLFSTCSLCFRDATFFDWSFVCLQGHHGIQGRRYMLCINETVVPLDM